MLDSLSSKDCFMDWVDVGEGVACHSGDIGGQSLPIPWRTLVLLQHQKVTINTLNTDNFSVRLKIDAFSPEDSAADMTRLKAQYSCKELHCYASKAASGETPQETARFQWHQVWSSNITENYIIPEPVVIDNPLGIPSVNSRCRQPWKWASSASVTFENRACHLVRTSTEIWTRTESHISLRAIGCIKMRSISSKVPTWNTAYPSQCRLCEQETTNFRQVLCWDHKEKAQLFCNQSTEFSTMIHKEVTTVLVQINNIECKHIEKTSKSLEKCASVLTFTPVFVSDDIKLGQIVFMSFN